MRLRFIFILCLLLVLPSLLMAQKFTFGPVNGINFSNLQGEIKYVTWKTKPGPVNGLFLKTSLPVSGLSIRTGAEHVSLYYKQLQDNTYYFPEELWPSYGLPGPGSSIAPDNSIIGPPYYRVSTWDYHFLRVPLLVEWKTPGRLSVGFGVGAQYAFLLNDEYTGKDKKLQSEEFREKNFPPSTDWGWMLSTSLNYRLNNQWNLFLEGRTTCGKEIYWENAEGKNGTTELLFGVGFSPFVKPDESRFASLSGQKIELLPHAGISFSKSTDEDLKKEYATLPGLNSGISVKYKMDSTFSLLSGAWYERKGYRMEKPSTSHIVYSPYENTETPPALRSDVMLDYLTIPFIAELSMESRFSINMQAGIYYSLLQNAIATGTETQTVHFAYGYKVEQEYFRQSVEGWFKNSDWGALTGVRFEYKLWPNMEIFTAMNRSWGFTRLAKQPEEDETDSTAEKLKHFKNRSWTATFGLAISITQDEDHE